MKTCKVCNELKRDTQFRRSEKKNGYDRWVTKVKVYVSYSGTCLYCESLINKAKYQAKKAARAVA